MATESQSSSADKNDPSRTLVPHVYEETDPLKTVVLWGPPSAEAILGQLLPPDISLFHSNFDVAAARDEFNGFVDILESEKVRVIQARDVVAPLLAERPGMPSKLDDLAAMIRKRAKEFQAVYGRSSSNMDSIEHILKRDTIALGDEKLAMP